MTTLSVSEQRSPGTGRAKRLITVSICLHQSQIDILAKRAASHKLGKSRVVQMLLDIEERESILRHEIAARLAQTRAFTQNIKLD